MKKKDVKYVVIAVALFACVLGVCIYNIVNHSNFWDANAAQILTLFIAISLAFWATQSKNDQRRAKDHIEHVIQKVQVLVVAEQFYTFDSHGNISESNKLFIISARKISNCIEVLKVYSKSFGFKDDVNYIEEQLKQYKEFVSEHLNDHEYLEKSESQLRRYSENIDSKCDQIILKLYK